MYKSDKIKAVLDMYKSGGEALEKTKWDELRRAIIERGEMLQRNHKSWNMATEGRLWEIDWILNKMGEIENG